MPNFLKLLRRRPLSEKGTIEKKVEEVTTFINRELLPFLQEFRDSTQSSDDENDEDIEAIQNEPFVTTSASATLTNESVSTNSTEIQPSFGSGIITWSINTASVVVAKLQDLTGLSVLGRDSSSSGVMAAITATAGNQVLRSNPAGTAIAWEVYLPTFYDNTVSGSLAPFLLPSTIRHDDILTFVITADVTITGIAMSDGSAPPNGFRLAINLRDQSGGAAPGHSITIVDADVAAGVAAFRTPGQVQGTTPGPSYIMRSEEEGLIIQYANIWRILAGTAAQAITGDITVGAGNGSTRDAQITAGVIVNADINASAAIALTKLATQNTNTVVANATAGSATPTAVAVGTNTVLGRVAGNIVAASLVNAQVSASAAIDLSKLATQAAETFVGNFTAGVAVPTALAGSTVAGAGLTYTTGGILAVGAGTGITVNANDVAVTIPLTDGDKGDITVSSSGTVFTVDSATITPAKLAVVASNIGVNFTIRVSFAAGAGGAPDDVTIYSSNAPFSFRILKTFFYISTTVAVSTVEVRTATAGGGTALSSLFGATVATEDPTITTSITATTTVAANGSAFVRRSDSGIAGEVILICVAT